MHVWCNMRDRKLGFIASEKTIGWPGFANSRVDQVQGQALSVSGIVAADQNLYCEKSSCRPKQTFCKEGNCLLLCVLTIAPAPPD